MLKKSFLSIPMLMLFINTLYCNIEAANQNGEQTPKEDNNQTADQTSNQTASNNNTQLASNDTTQTQKEETKKEDKLSSEDLFLQLDDNGLQTSEPVQCKKDVLKVFGFMDLTLDNSRNASPFEKSYCTTNTSTCCTYHDYKLANYTFVQGKKEIVEKFETLEELLILFKGNKLKDYIYSNPPDETCDLKFDILDKQKLNEHYDEYQEAYIDLKLEKIGNMLIDFEIYLKKLVWLRSNILCTVCNPEKQKFFSLEGDRKLKMDVYVGFCSEVWNLRYFEIEVLSMYQTFIKNITKFLRCKEEQIEPLELPEPLEIPENVLEIMKNDYKKCSSDSKLESEECKKFCFRDVFKYKFPVENFFYNVQVSLGVIFKALTGTSIQEYYQTVKGKSFEPQPKEAVIKMFFHDHIDKENANDVDLDWTYNQNEGVMIFNDFMSKKFVNAKPEDLHTFAFKFLEEHMREFVGIINYIAVGLLTFMIL